MSDTSELPLKWINNKRDPRPYGLYPSRSRDELGDGRKNLSDASKLPFEWINIPRDPRPSGLYPSGFRDGGMNLREASEFGFAHNAYATTTKAELAQYHNQSLFSPPITIITKVIDNDQLKSFPG